MFRRSEEGRRLRREMSKKLGKDYTPFQAKQPYLRRDGLMNTLTLALTKDNLVVMYQYPHGTNKGGFSMRHSAPSLTTSQYSHNNLLVLGTRKSTNTPQASMNTNSEALQRQRKNSSLTWII